MDGMVVTLIIRYYYVNSKPFFNITRFEKSSEVKWSFRSAHVPRPTVFHQKVSLNEAQYPAAAGDSGNHFSLEELDTKQLAKSVGWFIKLRSSCPSTISFRPWALSICFFMLFYMSSMRKTHQISSLFIGHLRLYDWLFSLVTWNETKTKPKLKLCNTIVFNIM